MFKLKMFQTSYSHAGYRSPPLSSAALAIAEVITLPIALPQALCLKCISCARKRDRDRGGKHPPLELVPGDAQCYVATIQHEKLNQIKEVI